MVRAHGWWRLSLRSLLVLVAMVGVALAPVAYRLRYAAKQQRIRQALEIHGWAWSYEWNLQAAAIRTDRWRPPEWAEDLLGSDFFYDVTWVRSPGSDDAPPLNDFRLFAQLPSLGRIELNGATTDAHLAELRNLENVKWLELNSAGITNEGLAHIAHYAKLTNLYLSKTSISDDGLKHLSQLRSIDWLDISYTKVTGNGFHHLRKLLKLSSLIADGAPLSGEGLEHLQPLSMLWLLSLSETDLSDSSVKKLQSLTQVNLLYIHNTKITEDGAGEIQKMLPADAVFSNEDVAEPAEE